MSDDQFAMLPPAQLRKTTPPPVPASTSATGQSLARALGNQFLGTSDNDDLPRDDTALGHAIAPPAVHEVLRSPGSPLPDDVRHDMEGRFGHDFDHVRIHTDTRAAESARAVAARAYTVGGHIVFGEGCFAPGTSTGRLTLLHELAHITQQPRSDPLPSQLRVSTEEDLAEREATRMARSRLDSTFEAQQPGKANLSGHRMPLGSAPLSVQRAPDIAEDQLASTPVETIMKDPQYFENGITSISFYTAELAILHFNDKSEISLGLVPEWIEAPFEAVDYRTARATHIPISPTAPSLGTGSVRFIPRGTELRDLPRGVTIADVLKSNELTRSIRFTHHANGRIVPTEVNTITAPRLCYALRDAEAQYVRRTDAIAAGAVEVLEALGWIITIASLAGALRGAAGRAAAGSRAVAGATAGVVGRAQGLLFSLFTRLLRTGATESITVEGVGFGGVRVATRATELLVSRGSILNISQIPARGRLIHSAFEQAAIQTARQAGLRTARVALETVQNARWAAYLESQGYTFEVIANNYGGFTRVLTKVFTL